MATVVGYVFYNLSNCCIKLALPNYFILFCRINKISLPKFKKTHLDITFINCYYDLSPLPLRAGKNYAKIKQHTANEHTAVIGGDGPSLCFCTK